MPERQGAKTQIIPQPAINAAILLHWTTLLCRDVSSILLEHLAECHLLRCRVIDVKTSIDLCFDSANPFLRFRLDIECATGWPVTPLRLTSARQYSRRVLMYAISDSPIIAGDAWLESFHSGSFPGKDRFLNLSLRQRKEKKPKRDARKGLISLHKIIWWASRESNTAPTDYESISLGDYGQQCLTTQEVRCC
jgi:hypothetical protein